MSYKSRENLKAVMKSLLEVYTREEIVEALDGIEFFKNGVGQIQAVESRYESNYPPGFDTSELD